MNKKAAAGVLSLILWAALLFCWWLFAGLRVNKFTKRLSEAGFTYLRTHDVDAYLWEMDACCEMPGAKHAMMSGIPARDYVAILKIQTLREAGCREEAFALLKTAQPEMKGERAQLLLGAEKEKLGIDDEQGMG